MLYSNFRWIVWWGRWKACRISVSQKNSQINHWSKKCKYILALRHLLAAETVTGSPKTVGTDFKGTVCPRDIIEEKKEGEEASFSF